MLKINYKKIDNKIIAIKNKDNFEQFYIIPRNISIKENKESSNYFYYIPSKLIKSFEVFISNFKQNSQMHSIVDNYFFHLLIDFDIDQLTFSENSEDIDLLFNEMRRKVQLNQNNKNGDSLVNSIFLTYITNKYKLNNYKTFL